MRSFLAFLIIFVLLQVTFTLALFGKSKSNRDLDPEDEEMLRSIEEAARSRQFQQHSDGGTEIDMTDPKKNVELGIQGISEIAKNPKLLAEALESLKDPEIAAEVQKMMADPAFQAEMKKFTDSPAYKSAIKKTQNVMETMEEDPVKLKMLQAQMADMMNA